MKTLVIAEHDNKDLSSSTLCAIAAAEKIGQEIDVLENDIYFFCKHLRDVFLL